MGFGGRCFRVQWGPSALRRFRRSGCRTVRLSTVRDSTPGQRRVPRPVDDGDVPSVVALSEGRRHNGRVANQSGGVTHMTLTAVGVDRPGIVAALAAVLEDLGCNLEDSTMSILRGHFAVLLIVAVPDTIGAETVEAALAPAAHRLDLTVAVRPLGELPSLTSNDQTGRSRTVGGAGADLGEGEVYVFSVHGADRPGIVERATRSLLEAGGNILDLSTRLVGPPDAPVYVLHLTVGFPPGSDAAGAADTVRATLGEVGVQVHAEPVEIDVL